MPRASLLFVGLCAAGLFAAQVGVQPANSQSTPQPRVTPAASPTPVEPTGSPVPAPSASPRISPSPLDVSPSPVAASASPGGSSAGGLTSAQLLSAFASATPAAAQAYSTFIRGADRQHGLIDLIRKDEEVYLDLDGDRLDRTYIFAPTIASGVGSSAFAGRSYEPFLVRFKRVGRRLLWLSPNPHFHAAEGTPAEASLQISVADSVIAVSTIVAEDRATHRIVIQPSLFLTDFEGVGADLGAGSAPSGGGFFLLLRPSFGLDASRSYYDRVKAFPKNDEFTVALTFAGPKNGLPDVPDGRGVPIKMHYSVVELPSGSNGYVPRLADDRVGYFISAIKRFDDDNRPTSFIRYINRWDLSHGPITFYLTKEIPTTYRPTIRRALLAWNDAFARQGHAHAIDVKDQPDDPSWDPEDIRYSSVRWITNDSNDFAAYSPSVVNPETGEILHASIVVDGESIRSVKRGYVEGVVQTRDYAREITDGFACTYAHDATVQAVVGTLALRAGHTLSAASVDQYAKEWLYSVILHEVGHTLGLRHNFQGSTAFTPAQLHDRAFTATHGISASVMDYNPINLAPPGMRQADFFQSRLGAYDYWAIQYGYRSFGARAPSDEAQNLNRIANESSRPEYGYSTDEDVADISGGDPRAEPFDLSSNPLQIDREQFRVADFLAARLDRTYPRDGRTYYEERQAFVTILLRQQRAAMLVANYVGGIYTSRTHRGQPGGAPPVSAIPRATQRRAFDLLARNVFSAQAFTYPPRLLNELGANRYSHWGSRVSIRKDYPIVEVIAALQNDVLGRLVSPASIARITNESLRARPGETLSLADLFDWTTAAIWDDLGPRPPASSTVHRDLQRRYTDLLAEIALLPTGAVAQLNLSHDAQSLARYELRQIDRRIQARMRVAKDRDALAHLDDVHSRIITDLNPSTVRPI